VIGQALHDPLEPIADAEDLEASSRARMVAAAITLLMPGAGPPPTRIANLFVCTSVIVSFTPRP
jgi:hypothetical protein